MLATPGLFEAGWHPDFLKPVRSGDPSAPLEGAVPGTQVKVRLVGACVERWKPISGWSLEHGKRGPKPVRRLVPAGSVYFFEVVEGDASQLADRWLKTVCTTADEGQAARDGFGLALWGVWKELPPP